MIKESFPQSRFILREHYVMASSRVLAEDLIQAVFDDDFELEDDEDSENEDTDDIYGYLGDPVLRRADLMAAALGEVQDDCERTELMAASLSREDEEQHGGSQEAYNGIESSIPSDTNTLDDGKETVACLIEMCLLHTW